jgi:hypothetical protein
LTRAIRGIWVELRQFRACRLGLSGSRAVQGAAGARMGKNRKSLLISAI